jgi:hypothetical protein
LELESEEEREDEKMMQDICRCNQCDGNQSRRVDDLRPLLEVLMDEEEGKRLNPCL